MEKGRTVMLRITSRSEHCHQTEALNVALHCALQLGWGGLGVRGLQCFHHTVDRNCPTF